MSQGRVLRLDQIVEGTGATVRVRLDADRSVLDAWFAMEDIPRIEPLLLGRPIAEIPGIVERLCGICPVAHHLAGLRTLEALMGAPTLTPTADSVRRALHHGAVLQTHAQALTGLDPHHARVLGAFGRRVVAAAGGDSHFPRCGVPGGVRWPLPVTRRDELTQQVGAALESSLALGSQLEARHRSNAPTYTGHDVALVDRDGSLDLYGDQLRAVAADGSVTVDAAGPDDWTELVAEACPGGSAPRPYLRASGRGLGTYRVGPVAQLRAPTHLRTPRAEAARQRWAAAGGDAAWARAVVSLHAVEIIEALLGRPELVAGALVVALNTDEPMCGRTASGWVDGARGLLVHSYRTDRTGGLGAATITTPTAQNEAWLAELLHSAVNDSAPIGVDAPRPERLRASLESAIREADPCLPCTSMPPGRMPVRLEVHITGETEAAGWLLQAAHPTGSNRPMAARAGR